MNSASIGNTLGLIGICWDTNSSFERGAAEAPPLIRRSLFSDHSNMWSESGIDLTGVFHDAGDLLQSETDDMPGAIESAIGGLLDRGLKPIALGGDHSITYPIMRAVGARHDRLSLLHIDAHPDLYDNFDENPYSHASPFARIMENGLVERLVQVGVRTVNGHQRQQAARFGVEMIEMKDYRGDFAPRFTTPVYVSIDLDGIDPAFAPGVSHQEPGGLTVRQVINLIQNLDTTIVGADIVEYNPRFDTNSITAHVCAKLVKELSGIMRKL